MTDNLAAKYLHAMEMHVHGSSLVTTLTLHDFRVLNRECNQINTCTLYIDGSAVSQLLLYYAVYQLYV
jgi:hypothetical protein